MKQVTSKRILSIVLTVILIIGMVPITTIAADDANEEEPIKIPATLYYQKLQRLRHPEIKNVNRPISFRTDA